MGANGMNLTVAVAVISVALIAVDVAKGNTEAVESPGVTDQDERHDMNEVRERNRACDCCSQCLAAQRDVRGKEEGPPALDGCRDCCDRCDSDLRLQQEMPPEIVK